MFDLKESAEEWYQMLVEMFMLYQKIVQKILIWGLKSGKTTTKVLRRWIANNIEWGWYFKSETNNRNGKCFTTNNFWPNRPKCKNLANGHYMNWMVNCRKATCEISGGVKWNIYRVLSRTKLSLSASPDGFDRKNVWISGGTRKVSCARSS